MEFNKENLRQIRRLLLFAAVLVLVIMYSNQVFFGIQFVYGIVKPFLYGGVIAFALNIPLKAYEEKLFKRWKGKSAARLKRPLCMVLSLLSVILVIVLVAVTVIPQVTETVKELGREIPAFTEDVIRELNRLTEDYPELTEQVKKLEQIEINWDSVLENVINFLQNGAGDVISSTVSVASGIISGTVNSIIAFIFSLYILSQKERLANQGRRVISAFLPQKAALKVLEICALLYKNFSSFITGQCLEAVILGTMFFIAMTIFRMPYALLVGVLIAFTALIPIVGAFIGCVVGTFLLLIDNPVQAIWFIVLFLVLQQVEGNLIYPKVVGNSVGLPSIWVLAAVSLGGSLFGVAGMLFFIPLMSSCYALFRDSVNARNARHGGIVELPAAMENTSGGEAKDTGKKVGSKQIKGRNNDR
ncbi:MAG: AI-2E family transporter [Acetatifactor sp.]|nr:AI-2E family transporter [Acetatifactor sp.]